MLWENYFERFHCRWFRGAGVISVLRLFKVLRKTIRLEPRANHDVRQRYFFPLRLVPGKSGVGMKLLIFNHCMKR